MGSAEYRVGLTGKGWENVLDQASQEYHASVRRLSETVVGWAKHIHELERLNIDRRTVAELAYEWRTLVDEQGGERRFSILSAMARAGVAVPEYRTEEEE